jgi:DNA-binding response OmpR family regulator
MSRGTCLVIENDEDIAGLITLILTQEGFDVHAVRTGRRDHADEMCLQQYGGVIASEL